MGSPEVEAGRPLPEPSPLTEEFWSAARRHELVRPVCSRCGHSHFTPQVACPHCLATDWSYRPSTGRGTVYSHTVVHRPPGPGFEPPYVLAVVDLDEGWSMLTNVVGCDVHDVHIGQAVQVRFDDVAPGVVVPVFAPAPAPPAPPPASPSAPTTPTAPAGSPAPVAAPEEPS
jgi:uncharacterized OB-fold protein